MDIESCLFVFFLNTGQHSKTVGCWCICQLYLPILPLYLPLELTCKKYIFALFFPPSLHTGFMFLHPFGNLLDSTYSLFVDTLILFKLKKNFKDRERKSNRERLIFSPLNHSPDSHQSQSLVDLKLKARDFFKVSCVGAGVHAHGPSSAAFSGRWQEAGLEVEQPYGMLVLQAKSSLLATVPAPRTHLF